MIIRNIYKFNNPNLTYNRRINKTYQSSKRLNQQHYLKIYFLKQWLIYLSDVGNN
jgi:hypothetical protein